MTVCALSILVSLVCGQEASLADAEALGRARDWIAASQSELGWVPSFGVPEPPIAWTWDQALALLALLPSHPQNASRLAAALVRAQSTDGSWPAGFEPVTGDAVRGQPRIGDAGLVTYALARYAQAYGAPNAMDSAQAGAAWLEGLQREDGSIADSTLANIAAWWGLVVTGRGERARRVDRYIATRTYDREGAWFLPRPDDRTLVCDVNTFGAMLLNANQQYGAARAAMVYLRSYLFLQDLQGRPALGITGPIGAWYEGTAQYVAAEGMDGRYFLRTLLEVQRDDGSVPHSDRTASRGLSWHTTASSLGATAWLCFAIDGSPLRITDDERRGLRRTPPAWTWREEEADPEEDQDEGELGASEDGP